jgi:hypothetical protein
MSLQKRIVAVDYEVVLRQYGIREITLPDSQWRSYSHWGLFDIGKPIQVLEGPRWFDNPVYAPSYAR